MFDHFYHEVIRKTIVAFGTLFNGMTIKRKNDSTEEVESIIKVPLAYGPTQKFLARLEQEPNLNKPVQITLPRMSFELVGLSYDPSRKLAPQSFSAAITTDKTDIRKAYMPVPYNLDIELSVMTLLNDDMLQIIEQIIPYFQPSFNLTIDLVSSIGEKRDVPITLEGISMQDNYEGDYTTRRSLIYTLKFTAKTYLFGPISGSESSKDIIKKVSIGFASGEYGNTSRRNVIYSVEATATKNYDGNVVTNLSQNISSSDTIIQVNDASNILENTYITINNETMYVKSKSQNTIIVDRGSYNTPISDHVLGSSIGTITQEDNELIPAGDDFGFNGNID